jgi:broad specificity phosphatase PhoE
MNLYLIRHGESLGNANPAIYFEMEDWKVPLTDKGKEQAEKVRQELKNLQKPYILSSPYVRAKGTANIIAESHGGFVNENGLIYERVWGNLRSEMATLKTQEERGRLFDFYHRPQNGESYADCYVRAFTFFEYLKNTFGYADMWNSDDVVVVSHGEFLKLLLIVIDDKTVEQFDKLPDIENCEIIKRTI